MISHSIFVGSLFFDLNLSMGAVSYVLLVLGFLLFVTEVALALSFEKNQLTLKNAGMILFMYFTYSQLWLLLVVYATYLEAKRVLLKQEVTWYKTQRFKEKETSENRSA